MAATALPHRPLVERVPKLQRSCPGSSDNESSAGVPSCSGEGVQYPGEGMREQVTLVRPGARDPAARGISSGFPADLLGQSAGRLRVLALLYAFIFFMAGIFPALLFPGDRAKFLGSVLQWAPGVIGIVVALLVAAVGGRGGRPPPAGGQPRAALGGARWPPVAAAPGA